MPVVTRGTDHSFSRLRKMDTEGLFQKLFLLELERVDSE